MDRANFANYCCELFMKQYTSVDKLIGDITKVETLYEFFQEHVRNIYELDDKIPLFNYYYHHKHGADNFGMNEFDFSIHLNNIENKITKQFNKIKNENEK